MFNRREDLVMMYWNNCLPAFLGTWWGLEILFPLEHWPLPHPWSKQVVFQQLKLQKASLFPLGIFKSKLRFHVNHLILIQSTHEWRWCVGSAPLDLYTFYPWIGAVQGQFQLRSQTPCLSYLTNDHSSLTKSAHLKKLWKPHSSCLDIRSAQSWMYYLGCCII